MQNESFVSEMWDNAMFSARNAILNRGTQHNDECIAVYLRLSDEDEEVKGHHQSESNSVVNQRKLIHHYIERDKELSSLPVVEYVDDGFSGARFDRPAFNRMMEDAKAGKFSVLITKDYSRIGRDYLEVGNYLEYIFPLLQIRYISINDGFDSDESYGSTGGMNQALKNLVNMMYSRDLSKKTRSAKLTKCRQGKYPFSHTPYGYVRSKEDKNQLVIETESAEVVRLIFDLALAGKSCYAIAIYLNESCVETIAEHAKRIGSGWRSPYNYDIKFWQDRSVKAILQNEVYIGRIVGNKTEKSIYTNHKVKKNNPEDWIIVDGCHEAIISKEVFDKVQILLGRKAGCDPKPSKEKREDREYFGGLFICGVCGRPYHKDGKKLYCAAHKAGSRQICRGRAVRYDTVIDTLTIYVEKFVSGFSSLGRQVKKCNSGEGKHRTELLEQEREQLAARKFQLYEKYRSGKISRETFQQENMMIIDRIKDIAEMLDEYRNRKEDAFESISGVYDKLCDDIVEIGKFDVEKYRQFIKYVAIYDEESLEVVWNINDPMQLPQ